MPKSKTTVTLDRRKVEEARHLTGARSTSATIDIALDALILAERLRRDIEMYQSEPPTDEEVALAAARPSWNDLTDDTDWDRVYAGDQ